MLIDTKLFRRSFAVGLLALVVVQTPPASAIEYALSPGVSVSGIAMHMKPDESGPLCFISVTVVNETGEDRVLEIGLESDDGYSVVTYTGGPNRKPLKTGGTETAEFKTLMRRLPKDLSIFVKPLD